MSKAHLSHASVFPAADTEPLKKPGGHSKQASMAASHDPRQGLPSKDHVRFWQAEALHTQLSSLGLALGLRAPDPQGWHAWSFS